MLVSVMVCGLVFVDEQCTRSDLVMYHVSFTLELREQSP